MPNIDHLNMGYWRGGEIETYRHFFTIFSFLLIPIVSITMSWELWKHPDPVPGGRPIFFKPESPKESKNGFKTISCCPYRKVIFSNYFFRYQKSLKKSKGFTSNSFPGHFNSINTLGDFRNISTISIFLLTVPPYNFCNFDTKMV